MTELSNHVGAEIQAVLLDLWQVPHLIAQARPRIDEATKLVEHRRKMLGGAHARQSTSDAGDTRALGNARRDVKLEAARARDELVRIFLRCERTDWSPLFASVASAAKGASSAAAWVTPLALTELAALSAEVGQCATRLALLEWDLVEFVADVDPAPAKRPRGRPRRDDGKGLAVAQNVATRRSRGVTYLAACDKVAAARSRAGQGVSEGHVRRLYRENGLEARLSTPEASDWMNNPTDAERREMLQRWRKMFRAKRLLRNL